MPGFKIHCRIQFRLCLVLAMGIFSATVHAAEQIQTPETDASLTNQTEFSAEVRDIGGRGFLTSRCAFVTIGTGRFTFLVPDGCRASTATEDRIILIKNDLSCVISLRAATGESSTLNQERQRQALLERFPDLEFTGEREIIVASNTGQAFDFLHKADGLNRKTRVGFVPSVVGVLEFKMTTAPDTFEAHQDIFNQILRTFRAAKPNGELDTVQLPVNS